MRTRLIPFVSVSLVVPIMGFFIELPTAYAKPTTAGGYAYHGCPLYGNDGMALEADISSAAVDSKSGAIISNISSSVNLGRAGNTASLERVNLATNATKTYVVHAVPSGHHPPITAGRYGGGAGARWPWQDGFAIEGTSLTGPPGDKHVVILNTQSCRTYEGDGVTWVRVKGPLSAYNGEVNNQKASYRFQAGRNDNVTVSGIPLYGATDYGEEASLGDIPHTIGLILPASVVLSGANGVNLSAGVGGDGACSGPLCTKYGDIYRLKSSVPCGGSDPQIRLLCTQLKKHGMTVTDTGKKTGLRFGLDTDGVNRWNPDVFTWFGNLTLSADFDLVARGSVRP